MSDSSPDVSVLGKRVRNEVGQNDNDIQASNNINPTIEDDSDDDVGPMPMPVQASAAKKKRRGNSIYHHSAFLKINFTDKLFQVLPHERLYLEHLPNADQYYKSFMHRDTINFSVITK